MKKIFMFFISIILFSSCELKTDKLDIEVESKERIAAYTYKQFDPVTQIYVFNNYPTRYFLYCKSTSLRKIEVDSVSYFNTNAGDMITVRVIPRSYTVKVIN